MAPATAGELVQGTIDGIDYLVNFPIDLFSIASVSDTPGLRGITVSTARQYRKAVLAVSQLLALSPTEQGLNLRFKSDVPRGKGLASSTSEIAAALQAAANLLGLELSAETSCLMNARVEATDCVQATGVSLVHQLQGRIVASFKPPPRISVIMVDCGGSIETDEFDREKFHSVARKNEAAHKEARELLVRGLTTGCPQQVGKAATMSTVINQKVVFKEQLPALLDLVRLEGGIGVNCAHSGTVLGLMYESHRVQERALFAKMQKMFGKENVFAPHRLISGGVREIIS